jgi:hypothetical protein
LPGLVRIKYQWSGACDDIDPPFEHQKLSENED